MDLPALFESAVRLHQQGRLAEADAPCRQILAADPSNFSANNLLGIIRFQQGQNSEALALIGAALRKRPDAAAALNTQGLILESLLRRDEALASFDKALALKPDYALALNNRGQVLLTLGRCAEALLSFDKALAIEPGYFDALSNRANALHILGRHEDALAGFDKALAVKPDHFQTLHNRGLALLLLGRFDEAVAGYERALAIAPDNADTLFNRGAALEGLGRFEDALTSYDRAIAARPGHAHAFLARGLILRQLHRPGEAVRSYDRALTLQPDFFDAHFQRGLALYDLGQSEQAIASYDKAIALKPDFFNAINNRSWALVRLRRFAEASEGYRRLEALSPGNAVALNGEAFLATQLCDWSRREEFLARMREQVAQKSPDIQTGTLIGYNDDPTLQFAGARNIAAGIVPPAGPPLRRSRPFSGEKIRLAYCSGNFMSHPMPRLLAGMFENHDRSRFEVMAISFSVDDRSEMRRRLVNAFDQFHHVLDSSDHDVAAQIADLGVDIVIDLMGFTTGARTAIFAARPAPIQVNYMGYPSTMATGYHDYIIADRTVLPMHQQPFYSEKIIQLPDSYFGTDGARDAAGPAPSRAEAGLPERGFVFCCFNNNWKIVQPQFDIWMRLLAQVPDSVLWLLHDNKEVAESLRRQAGERGIAPERLIFAPRVKQDEHLARHRLADLFLDTLPYNAHTTACDALWVGVPLVTALGRSFYARVAASLLQAADLPELITDNPAGYEALALALARDPMRLSALKRKLETARTTTPLFNTKLFTRNMEASFTGMRDIWLRGESPHGFLVEP